VSCRDRGAVDPDLGPAPRFGMFISTAANHTGPERRLTRPPRREVEPPRLPPNQLGGLDTQGFASLRTVVMCGSVRLRSTRFTVLRKVLLSQRPHATYTAKSESSRLKQDLFTIGVRGRRILGSSPYQRSPKFSTPVIGGTLR
jgi:hypothetical protein